VCAKVKKDMVSCKRLMDIRAVVSLLSISLDISLWAAIISDGFPTRLEISQKAFALFPVTISLLMAYS
jgi:hypothetical protein